MLVRSKKRVFPSEVNIIVLQDKLGYYYYVDRDTYDQAVVLTDRYGKYIGSLEDILGSPLTERGRLFMEAVPAPLSILGMFLYLVPDDISNDIDVLCGAIHVMSTINFRTFISVPDELRRSIRYSLSVQEEYQLAWDLFLNQQGILNAQHKEVESTGESIFGLDPNELRMDKLDLFGDLDEEEEEEEIKAVEKPKVEETSPASQAAKLLASMREVKEHV